MNKLRNPAFYLLLVFLSGAAAGAFGYRLYSMNSVAASTNGPVSPEKWRDRYVTELRTRLNLNPDQVSKLGTILEETRAEMHRLRPQMNAIQEEQVKKVRAMLTPEQLGEYEKIVAAREKHHPRGW